MIKHRIDLITLGCSKNLVDSEHLMAQLSAVGYKLHHDPEDPRAKSSSSIHAVLSAMPRKSRSTQSWV